LAPFRILSRSDKNTFYQNILGIPSSILSQEMPSFLYFIAKNISEILASGIAKYFCVGT
jgi:hypothetical protein